jgi:hypothetical protein
VVSQKEKEFAYIELNAFRIQHILPRAITITFTIHLQNLFKDEGRGGTLIFEESSNVKMETCFELIED